ncbi:DgyrCDS13177 [Dimorphilus gyrociliatus]|uniref:DgyrCDS13177 n=1 Tax=Dimorphilus gyrociliatus TaxID=2664684 RepID=A0A7I8W9Z8_9ANNE|nr:DgyrCDS13177 [Dimorphilus gyrociliatus]
MGNNFALPTDKKEESIDGIDYYYIDVDLSDRTVLYDYLLQKKVRKENGKWKFEGYSNIREKNSKEVAQISLMYHFINHGRWLEKKGPKGDVESNEDADDEKEYGLMKKSFFQELTNTGSDDQSDIPYCVLPVYYPGETVRGKLRLKTTKPFDLENINVAFTGGAFTRYRIHTGRGYYDSVAEDKYVDSKMVLWNKGGNFSDIKSKNPSAGDSFRPGEYEWPFEFHIPLDGTFSSVPCLNPCKVNYGYAGCRIKATMDKGNLFSRGSMISCFGVWIEKESDVAANLENLNPVLDKKYQQTGLFNDGFIQLVVKLPKSGYVIGEDIPLNVEVDNRSSGPIECIEAMLVLSGKYNTGASKFSCTKSFKHCSDRLTSGPISSGESPVFDWTLRMVFSNTEIDEHLLPTSDLACSLLKVKYNLYVTAKRAKLHKDVVLKIPIEIGNVNSKEMKTFSYLHDLNSEP